MDKFTIWSVVSEPSNKRETLYSKRPSQFEVFVSHGPPEDGDVNKMYEIEVDVLSRKDLGNVSFKFDIVLE